MILKTLDYGLRSALFVGTLGISEILRDSDDDKEAKLTDAERKELEDYRKREREEYTKLKQAQKGE